MWGPHRGLLRAQHGMAISLAVACDASAGAGNCPTLFFEIFCTQVTRVKVKIVHAEYA